MHIIHSTNKDPKSNGLSNKSSNYRRDVSSVAESENVQES
jgi:hypothetical protein